MIQKRNVNTRVCADELATYTRTTATICSDSITMLELQSSGRCDDHFALACLAKKKRNLNLKTPCRIDHPS